VTVTAVTSIMVEVVKSVDSSCVYRVKKILHFPGCFASYMCTSLSGVCYFFFLAAAAHPDETQLHSSQLAYDFYNNPPVGIYQPGAENIHNLP
jgi:hypothetical protein